MPHTLPQTTAEHVLRAAEGTNLFRPEATSDKVARFLGGTEDRARNALDIAVQLGFADNGSVVDSWRPTELARVLAAADPDGKGVLLRWRLGQFPPYAVFRNRVIAGETPQEAARQTLVVHEIDDVDAMDAENTLLNLATYSKSMVYGEQRRLLVSGDEDLLKVVLQIHSVVMATRDTVQGHVVQKLGVEAAAFATGETLDLLVDAYLGILDEKPLHETLYTLGLALESWVKKVATIEPAISLPRGTNTLGAVVNYLKGQGRLTSKHHALLMGLAGVRNAADHTADPEIQGATWRFERDTTLAMHHLTWNVMRSFFAAQAGEYVL